MKKELEHKIVEAHPLLYRDRYADPRSTCMCWGLSVGDGWYKIIWDLSQKLEPLIQKFIDDNPGLKCYQCSCEEAVHTNDGCKAIHHLPHMVGYRIWGYPVPQWRRDFWPSFTNKHRFRVFWQHQVWQWIKGRSRGITRPINRFLQWLYDKYNIGYDKPCPCKKFKLNHPCASQVKEKFGSMRFYMTSATEEMWSLIHKAEAEASNTCEACGEPGEERNDGWVVTLCDSCQRAKKEGGKPVWQILQEQSPYYEEESNSSKN